ncbi:MAG: response regulator [Cellulosilyticum sp.]|nr:response regulator [Cellulosilyticum sp.]
MYRILVADDEIIEQMVICKKIKAHFKDKLEIIQAVNGREAVALFEEKLCQIVLLDVEMPGVNGLEAAEKIREKNKDCVIIFLSAYDYFTYAKKALIVKAANYLLKPCLDEELIEVLEEVIIGIESRDTKNVLDSGRMEQIRSSEAQERILNFIKTHYIEDLSLQDVAQEMNYADAYFCKVFKQYFHKSFTTYLSEFRVEKAKELLMDVTINVKEISDKVGYRDSNYFTKVFKRIEGMTPSEYRMWALENKRNLMTERVVE